MLKFNRVVCVALVCAVVGVAWGAASRIPSFVVEPTYPTCSGVCTNGAPCTLDFPCTDGSDCVGIGDPIPIVVDPDADGMAILNYVAGADKTVVLVIVSDFSGAPISGFIVRLNPDVGDLGFFSLDSQGNGHFRGEIAGDHSGSNVELWQQVQPPSASCPAVLIATGQ